MVFTEFDYNLEVDTLKSDIGAASRFFFMTDGGSEATSIADTVELKKDVRSCYLTKAYLRVCVVDKFVKLLKI